jgi:hypothetical protein
MNTQGVRHVQDQFWAPRMIEYRAVLLGIVLSLLFFIPSVAATAEIRTAVGDSGVCYWNPEFSSEGHYVVWYESKSGASSGQVWHCAVNPDTGALDPPDCKGFRAFKGTLDGHANFGSDDQGAYYVGANVQGELVLVRPTSAQDGTVEILSTAADAKRHGIYASRLPNSDKRYVYWLRTADGFTPGAGEVELRYIDLASPTQEIEIARQRRPSGGWAPLETGFPRWFAGSPMLVYGIRDSSGYIQLEMVDVSRADLSPMQITADPHDKIDAFPFTSGGRRYLMAGIDHTSTSRLYAEDLDHQFRPVDTVTPPASALQQPCLAQSHEPFELGGNLYTAYQISDCGSGNFFTAAGEVWLSTLRTSPQQQWRLSSPGDRVNNEPEPLVATSKAWVFYSSYATGQDPQTACPQLWRVDVSPGAGLATR